MTKLIKKKIPSGWQQVKLGDVVDVISGGTPSTVNSDFWNGGINWITPTEITKIDKYIKKPTAKTISESGLNNSSARLLPVGSLVVCSRATIGECAISTYPITTNQGFKNLVPNQKILVNFLYYHFLILKHDLLRISSGSTFLEFSKNDVQKLRIDLPPLPEQKRIVAVLETWDEAIDTLTKKIELKEQIKKGLMQQLLTGKKRLPGFSGEWEERRLGDIGEIVTGNTPPKKDIENYGEEYCWATAEDFHSKYINDTKIKMSERGKHLSRFLPTNSVLVTCIASLGKNAIAKVPLATNQQINSIIVNNENNFEFVFYLVDNSTNILKRYAGGGALLLLNKLDFSKIRFLFPEIKEQKAIAKVLTSADKEIELLKSKLQNIKDQKKYLLNNLVTGKIRTPQDMKNI